MEERTLGVEDLLEEEENHKKQKVRQVATKIKARSQEVVSEVEDLMVEADLEDKVEVQTHF